MIPTADDPAPVDTATAATEIRRIIIEQSMRANIGHIGSALSVADVLAALYSEVLNLPGGDDPERDRFVLSKGHAALALYATLHVSGHMDEDTLASYATDGSALGAHPEHAVQGIDFSTGSLGQGLSVAAGAALGARIQGSSRRAFALMSDAELNEGSVWEAAMFACHHALSNLIAIVDDNGQQALGHTAAVLDLGSLADRWTAFGWHVIELDGHDTDGLVTAISDLDADSGPPHVIIADTTFGKGVSFMEGKIEWHYLPLDDAQFHQALDELAEARDS